MKQSTYLICLLTATIVLGACHPKPFFAPSVKDTGTSLDYSNDGHLLFSYNYATIYPPAGVDSVFRRSGFIHPLNTLKGETLTNCSPTDHRHHFGLWYAWTKTTFQGKETDFWNLQKRQGTVRFLQFERISSDGFIATLEHVAYPDSTAETTAMTETLDIRIGDAEGKGYYLDYRTTLRCTGSDSITLEAYRYGGICLRIRPDWNDRTCNMLTSEGKDRNHADGSHARWCYLQGKAGKETACLLVVASPENLNYPEPLRVWDSKANPPDEDIMWNFSPTKEKPFTLQPGSELRLAYRIYVLDDKIDASEAERLASDAFSIGEQLKEMERNGRH